MGWIGRHHSRAVLGSNGGKRVLSIWTGCAQLLCAQLLCALLWGRCLAAKRYDLTPPALTATGELSYESDAAERLRSELRAMQASQGERIWTCGLGAGAAILLSQHHMRPKQLPALELSCEGFSRTSLPQQAEAHSLRNELDAAKLAALRQQEAVAAAEAAAAAAQQQLEAQREGEGVLQVRRAV